MQPLPKKLSRFGFWPRYPSGLALDARENLYVADFVYGCVFMADLGSGNVTTIPTGAVASRRRSASGGRDVVGIGLGPGAGEGIPQEQPGRMAGRRGDVEDRVGPGRAVVRGAGGSGDRLRAMRS